MYPCRTGSSVCAAAALIPPAPSLLHSKTHRREIPYRKAGGSRKFPHPPLLPIPPGKKTRPVLSQAVSAEALRRADRLPFLPRPDKKVPFPVPSTSAAFAMERSPACHHEQKKKNRQHQRGFFSLATPNVSCIASAIEFACVILPIPRDTSTVLPAKTQPASFASRSPGNALVSVTIGPPQYVPSFLCIRYCTEKKTLRKFQSKSHNRRQHHPSQCSLVLQAPLRRQPPRYCPSPISAASSVISDANGETPASVFSPLYLPSRPNAVLSAKNNRRMGSARSWMVRKNACPKQQKKKRRPQAAAFHRF